MPQQNISGNVWQNVAQNAAMASFRRASNQAEWQRPPQRTPYCHIAYLPTGALHSAPFPMPPGRPTAHPGQFESGLPRSARPIPPPPRRVLSQAQAALSLTGQAHIQLQPAVHQVSLGVGKVPTQKFRGPFTYSKANKYASLSPGGSQGSLSPAGCRPL